MVQDYLKATQENTDLTEFFQAALKLKTIKRQGWKDRLAMKNPESVAEHCFAMSAIAMVLSDHEKLNTFKIIQMSLLHDLAESIVGDLTPNQVTKAEKTRLENKAMKQILQNLSKKVRKNYWQIWQEYQRKTTKESIFVHHVDKLEMALQAAIYGKNHSKKKLQPFFESAKNEISNVGMAKFIPGL
jgi:putative hydrolase of HD superfamily